MKLTFPREKVIELLEHAEAAAERRPTLEQIVTPECWRDDMDSTRRQRLMAEVTADGFAFSAEAADVDMAKIPAGLTLVGDQGVYLMSNGLPGLPTGENVAYAIEVNPRKLDFDTWWNAKRASFGADDGTVPISAEAVRAFLPPEGDLVLDVTEDAIAFMPHANDEKGPSLG